MTTVCRDTMTRKPNSLRDRRWLQWYQSRASNKTPQKCVQGKRSTDLSDLSLNWMAEWRGKSSKWETCFVSSHGWRGCHKYRRFVHTDLQEVLRTSARFLATSFPVRTCQSERWRWHWEFRSVPPFDSQFSFSAYFLAVESLWPIRCTILRLLRRYWADWQK